MFKGKLILKSFVTAAAAAGVVVFAIGCGGSDDKPAYCDKKDELTASITGLKDISLTSLPTDLPNQVKTIQNNATAFANATEDAFPEQSQELEGQVQGLSQDVSDLTNGEKVSASQAVQIVAQITGTISAAEALQSKVNEGCK